MKRALVLGLILALAAGAWWVFGRSGVRERGERGSEQAAATGEKAESSELVASVPHVERVSVPQREERGEWDEAELARATWIEGRVLFPEGTPADERAFVRAMGKKFARGELHRVAVAADGSFRVAFAEGTKGGRLRLEARYLFLEQVAPWKTKTGELVTLAPRLGGRIEGRVVWPQGSAPDNSGTVFAEVESGFGERSLTLAPDSRFAFDALDPGEPRTLRYAGARHLALSEPVVVEAGKTSSIELEARAGVVLAGSVRDDAGKPVAQVNMALQALSDRSTTTAPDGSFRLVVDPGPCVLWVHAQGYEDQTFNLGSLALGEERSGIEVVLPRGGVVAGRVEWPDGTPASALVATADLRTRDQGGYAQAESDGSFEIAGLGKGPFRIHAVCAKPEGTGVGKERKSSVSSEFWQVELNGVEPGQLDLVLVLSPGYEVTGVARTVDGIGLEEFEVAATSLAPRSSIFLPMERAFEGTTGRFFLRGLLPGEWELCCRAPGFVEEKMRLVVPVNEPVEIILTRGARLAGRVLDAHGRPVEGADVALDDSFYSAFFGGGRDALKTGPDGAFSFEGLRAGTLELTVKKEAYIAAEESFELEPGEVRLDQQISLFRGGTLEGLVIGTDRKPALGASVWLEGASFDTIVDVKTDSQGTFRMSGVPSGEQTLQVQLREGLSFSAKAQVEAESTTRVRLEPPIESIVKLHGLVTIGGEPMSGLHVSAMHVGAAEGDPSSSVQCDSSGRYALVLAGPGRYLIEVEHFDLWYSWREELDVLAGEHRHDVAAEAGRLRGRVTTREGGPLRDFKVEAQSVAGGWSRTSTDDQGHYEFFVAPGVWSLSAGGSGETPDDARSFAAVRRDDLLLRAGETREGIDLVLQPGASLAVRLVREDGAPVADGAVLGFDGSAWEDLGYSGSDGSVRVHGLTSGTLRLEATGNRCATRAAVAVTLAEAESSELTLVLHPAVPVELRVRLGGKSAGGLELTLTDETGAGRPARAWGDVTDLGPLPAGRYVLRARSGTHHAERAFDVRGDESELLLELDLE